MYYETIFYFSDWYYSCIRSSFKFSKESFRMDIKKFFGNYWQNLRWKTATWDWKRSNKISALSSSKIYKYEYAADE